jgi:hypothetical protein
LPIARPSSTKYKLCEVLGLGNQKQRWLSYLVNKLKIIGIFVCHYLFIIIVNIKDSLRLTIAEKGIEFSKSFREQKNELLPIIIKNVRL